MSLWTQEDAAAFHARWGAARLPTLQHFYYPGDPASNFDPDAICKHTPDVTYTREPCSCGRSLWPPRGRGRGESRYSARRIEARLKTLEAYRLHMSGLSYAKIAAKLGYADHSGPAHAIQRLLNEQAMWLQWERAERAAGGQPRRNPWTQRCYTERDIARVVAEMEQDDQMEADRLAWAEDQMRRLLPVVHVAARRTRQVGT